MIHQVLLFLVIIQTILIRGMGLVSINKIDEMGGTTKNFCANPKSSTHSENSKLEYSSDLRSILATVKSIDFTNFASSFLSLIGPSAFPILAGKRSTPQNQYGPILAGSRYGRGRLIVGGHTHFLQLVPTDLTSDHNKLLLNCLRWLAASQTQNESRRTIINRPKIALYQISTNFVLDTLFDVTEILIEDLQSSQFHDHQDEPAHFQVLCVGNTPSIYQNQKVSTAILKFVSNGGGLFITNTAWAWTNPQSLRLANQLIAPAGIIWEVSDKYAEPTIPNSNSFNVSANLLRNIHAEKLWNQILRFLSGQKAGNHQKMSCQLLDAMSIVEKAVFSFPPNENFFMRGQFIESISKLNLSTFFPPNLVQVEEPLEKLVLYVNHLLLSIEKKIEANPSAKFFPGQLLIPPRAPNFEIENEDDHTIQLKISPQQSSAICDKGGRVKEKYWLSTGLYAPAGEMIHLNFSLTFPPNQIVEERHRHFIIQIGSHTDDLSAKNEWRRFPRLTIQSHVVVVRGNQMEEMKLTSQFGGLIYLIILKGSPCSKILAGNFYDQLTIRARGPIKAPYFVLGQTKAEDWLIDVKKFRGPWAEFESEKIILTVPTMEAREVDEPQLLMETWNQILDGFDEISSTNRVGSRAERIVADIQISGGWLHAGYPIMMHLESARDALNLSRLKSPASWGHLHELGHNRVREIYQWEGTEEVMNNVFVIYVYEEVLKVSRQTFKKKADKEFQQKLVRQYLRNGKRFVDWQNNHELALTMFLQLQDHFGWPAFKKLFQKYDALQNNPPPSPPGPTRDRNEGKRDLFVFMLSSVVEKNLVHFFTSWGIPVSKRIFEILENTFPPSSISIGHLLE